jgi:general nucleoside transport system ATP-binding protein
MLTVTSVSKSYGPVTALSDVSATFAPGEIHAVLGENGAGKSTLMGILAGFVVPDRGSVTLDGKEIPYGRPFECKRLGIEMIHQHFTLVPQFTVAENLALARIQGGPRPLSVSASAASGQQLADRLGWSIEPTTKTRALSVGAQQRLEILKALSGDAGVVIFDEPTAVLSPGEVEDLFRVLRELKVLGKTVILIAHKLSEVMAIADRVTVLRRGRWIASRPIDEVTPQQLAEWMVGEMPAPLAAGTQSSGDPKITLSDVVVLGDRREQAVRGVSLTIAKGEILGIGGVDGNGQVELAEALAAIRPIASGSIDRGDASVGYIPQDRQQDGLAMGMSISDNLLIAGHRKPGLARGPFLVGKGISVWVSSLIERFGIKVGRPADPVASLSGGNQQKVVVSRTLDTTPGLLVAVNPTRGLDIKATEFVHSVLLQARDAGAAIALLTTDLDELAALSTRRVFLSRGQIVEEQDAAALLGGAG